MAESPSNDDSGCLGVFLGGIAVVALVVALINFVQWLWTVAVRMVTWILAWPFFTGHLLLSLLAILVCGAVVAVLAELLLRALWPSQFTQASARATAALQGRVFRSEREVVQFSDLDSIDPEANSARALFLRCEPFSRRNPEWGIDIGWHTVAEIGVAPDDCRVSKRLRTLRQPTRTYVESLRRAGLEPMDEDSIEAKAWQAVHDSAEELKRLEALHSKATGLLNDAQAVLQFSEDNELVTPVRIRSLALIPKLTADVARIDERSLALRSFGYKLFEFLNVPASLRSADLSDDIESTLLAQRGLSDDLFDEIRSIEKAYDELLVH